MEWNSLRRTCSDAGSAEGLTGTNVLKPMGQSRISAYAQTAKRRMKRKKTTGAGCKTQPHTRIIIRFVIFIEAFHAVCWTTWHESAMLSPNQLKPRYAIMSAACPLGKTCALKLVVLKYFQWDIQEMTHKMSQIINTAELNYASRGR